jgi:hypothetical protein
VTALRNNAFAKGIHHVVPNPLKVVIYKLHVSEMLGIDDDRLWYKDQGGRDRAITLKIQMRDRKNAQALPSDKIPLQCRLMYGIGELVWKTKPT